MVDENTVGREPVTIVEIDQDFCSLTYSNSPCQAALGVTGSFKCYNTLATCQDTANYNTGTPITLRFCTPSSNFPSPSEAEQYIPIVESVSTNSTEINLSNGNASLSPLGKRASITIKMKDIPYNDAIVDNYLSTRGFDPLDKSTFWQKWLARNLYYQNRPLRVRDGYIGQSIGSMRTRNFIIEKISGVDSNGKVTIIAKDILKLAEDKRAQAPVANTGTLVADITVGATSATLSPAGIGNSEYAASGTLIIGSELMTFTRSSDTLTLTRAQNNTIATAHSEDDAVQECLTYTDQRVDVIIEDLLETYGNIDPSYITTADWTAEADTWLSDSILTTIITEPTGVTELIGELLEQTSTVIWWDDVNQKIRFKAIRPVNADTITDITQDANIITNSVSVTRQAKQRLSQAWIYYDIFNFVTDLDEPSNFRKLQVTVDLDKESADQYGESRIKKTFSRWIGSEDLSVALSSAGKSVLIYKDNPIYIQFDVDAKDRSLDIMDVVRFNHRSFVDSQGDLQNTLFQIISREEIESGHKIRYKCIKFGFIGRFAFIMANSANDFGSATQAELDKGAYISDNNGKMSDGSDGWKIA